jgi:hypothetical protein
MLARVRQLALTSARWSRAGFIVALVAALGFVFAVAMSAQRSARMHAALGIAIETEKPGSSAWSDDLSDVASDDEDGDPDELAPPGDPPPPPALGDEGPRARPRRFAMLEPESPDLASEDDPP